MLAPLLGLAKSIYYILKINLLLTGLSHNINIFASLQRLIYEVEYLSVR